MSLIVPPGCQNMNMKELRAHASKYNIKGRSKQDICDRLNQLQRAQDSDKTRLHHKSGQVGVFTKPKVSHKKQAVTKLPQDRQSRFERVLEEIHQHSPTMKCSGSKLAGVEWINYLLKHHEFEGCVVSSINATIERIGILQLRFKEDHKTGKTLTNATVPLNIKKEIKNCTHDIVIIALSLRRDKSGHRNMIIIDKKNKTYERFEPNGHKYFLFKFADTWLNTTFHQYLPSTNYTFLPIEEVCPYVGPQSKSNRNNICKFIGTPGGYCVTYSLMFIHLRLMFSDATREEIYNMWLQLTPGELLDTILRYQGWIEKVTGE